jgi:hypothetical protein
MPFSGHFVMQGRLLSDVVSSGLATIRPEFESPSIRLDELIGLKSSAGPPSWDSVLDGSVVDTLPLRLSRVECLPSKSGQQRTSVLPGTLDMLILRTLLYGPAQGVMWPEAEESSG